MTRSVGEKRPRPGGNVPVPHHRVETAPGSRSQRCHGRSRDQRRRALPQRFVAGGDVVGAGEVPAQRVNACRDVAGPREVVRQGFVPGRDVVAAVVAEQGVVTAQRPVAHRGVFAAPVVAERVGADRRVEVAVRVCAQRVRPDRGVVGSVGRAQQRVRTVRDVVAAGREIRHHGESRADVVRPRERSVERVASGSDVAAQVVINRRRRRQASRRHHPQPDHDDRRDDCDDATPRRGAHEPDSLPEHTALSLSLDETSGPVAPSLFLGGTQYARMPSGRRARASTAAMTRLRPAAFAA